MKKIVAIFGPVLTCFTTILLSSALSYAQSSTTSDTTKEIVKNVGIVMYECPVSYSAKVFTAVGETVPVLSAFTKIGHSLNESSKQLKAIRNNEVVVDNSYAGHGHGRTFTSYFWGGIVASVYESIKQVGTGELKSEEIQKAFNDGYFVTRSETQGTKACSEAASQINMLIKKSQQN